MINRHSRQTGAHGQGQRNQRHGSGLTGEEGDILRYKSRRKKYRQGANDIRGALLGNLGGLSAALRDRTTVRDVVRAADAPDVQDGAKRSNWQGILPLNRCQRSATGSRMHRARAPLPVKTQQRQPGQLLNTSPSVRYSTDKS